MIIQAQTDEEVIDAWLAMKNSEKTKEQYSYHVLTALTAMNKTMNAVTFDDLLSYARVLEKRELALATRALRFAALKSLFKFAAAIGYITENPLSVFTFKPQDSDRRRLIEEARKEIKKKMLTPEQVEQMVATETNPVHRLLIRVLYLSAGRISEVLNATWADLVPNEKDKGGRLIMLAKGQRIVTPTLPEDLFQELTAMSGKPEEYIFCAKDSDKPMSRQNAWKAVKKVAKRIGANWKTSPHTLRHSHASHALANGATVAQVKEQLGHASLASTAIYTHADEHDTSVHVLGLK